MPLPILHGPLYGASWSMPSSLSRPHTVLNKSARVELSEQKSWSGCPRFGCALGQGKISPTSSLQSILSSCQFRLIEYFVTDMARLTCCTSLNKQLTHVKWNFHGVFTSDFFSQYYVNFERRSFDKLWNDYLDW